MVNENARLFSFLFLYVAQKSTSRRDFSLRNEEKLIKKCLKQIT